MKLMIDALNENGNIYYDYTGANKIFTLLIVFKDIYNLLSWMKTQSN